MAEYDTLRLRLELLETDFGHRLARVERFIEEKWGDEVQQEIESAIASALESPAEPSLTVTTADLTPDAVAEPIAVMASEPKLEAATTAVSVATATSSSSASVDEVLQVEQPRAELPQWIRNFGDIEWLTSRLGIGLLLIGIMTLFFWLNELPWVTDTMRLATGYTIGGALLGAGFLLTGRRADFGQLVAGGGIATFYITTFVGRFFLEAIPDTPAFLLIMATTAVAYGVATWQRQPIFAYIGLVFGLVAPPVINPDVPSILGLVIYIGLIVGGVVGIHARLRWHYLMLTAAIGSWLYAMGTALNVNFETGLANADIVADTIAVQAFLIFNLIAFGLLPIFLAYTDSRGLDAMMDATISRWQQVHWTTFPYVVASPILTAVLTFAIWPDMNSVFWASLMIAMAHAYIGLGLWIGNIGRIEVLQIPLFIAGGLLLPLAFFNGGENIVAPLVILFAIEAAGFTALAQRQERPQIMIFPHVLIVASTLAWLVGILPDSVDQAFLNLNFLAGFLLTASVVVVAWHVAHPVGKGIYQLLAHILLLSVFAPELYTAADGELIWFTNWLIVQFAANMIALGISYYRKNRLLQYQTIFLFGLALFSQWVADVAFDLEWANLLLVLSSGYIAAVCWANGKWKDQLAEFSAGILIVLGLGMILTRLGVGELGVPFFGPLGIATLLSLIMITTAVCLYTKGQAQKVFIMIAHITFLTWLTTQSSDFSNAAGITSGLWAAYSVILLVLGLRLNLRYLRNMGIGTILLTVAKLFLFDLENVSTGGRVLLFSGFGGVLLLLSYFSRNLWRNDEPAVLSAQEDEPSAQDMDDLS